MAQKFGQKRYQPPGEWVQTTLTLSVVGLQFRRSEVDAFCRAVLAAEDKGLRYGVAIRPDPDNPHDANAIGVFGLAEVKPWLGRVRVDEWPIGFLDRETAAELQDDLVARGLPLAGQLYSIYRSDEGFTDIKVIVLAPPGFSHSKRLRSRG